MSIRSGISHAALHLGSKSFEGRGFRHGDPLAGACWYGLDAPIRTRLRGPLILN